MNATIEHKLYGTDLLGEADAPPCSGPVARRFIIPPFSLLDARSADWGCRKAAWIGTGLEGEVGRLGVECKLPPSATNDYERLIVNSAIGAGVKGGVSIFDPVLCELIYRWFCPSGGHVIDPFAGGSVRGVVAGCLGLNYYGCDLSAKQIAANERQADVIRPMKRPHWICGDAMEELNNLPEADLIFSCPPYGDLERYSDDPRDLSTMEWHTFIAAYSRIILRACRGLKSDRFACFVVGDFRDDRGFYRDFVSETTRAFRAAGLELYNEAILATNIGSAAMRVTRQFSTGRKLCKTHQNVMVYCKGNWRSAAKLITT